MGDITTIEWTDYTWNPWQGCTKVSDGCKNCYAESINKRFRGGENWGKGAVRKRASEATLRLPLKWNREAEKAGKRMKVFCLSMGDRFIRYRGICFFRANGAVV